MGVGKKKQYAVASLTMPSPVVECASCVSQGCITCLLNLFCVFPVVPCRAELVLATLQESVLEVPMPEMTPRPASPLPCIVQPSHQPAAWQQQQHQQPGGCRASGRGKQCGWELRHGLHHIYVGAFGLTSYHRAYYDLAKSFIIEGVGQVGWGLMTEPGTNM